MTPLQMFQSSTLCLGQKARKLPMHKIYFSCVYNKNDQGHRLPRQLSSFITMIRRIKKSLQSGVGQLYDTLSHNNICFKKKH